MSAQIKRLKFRYVFLFMYLKTRLVGLKFYRAFNLYSIIACLLPWAKHLIKLLMDFCLGDY